jgi:phospholipase/carboxylesterase
MSLNYLELKNTSENCNKLIFILHGYGADSNDLFSIATYWQRFLPDAYFCVPNAPNSCQVNPAGFEWFDLMQTNNETIIEESLVSLKKLEDTIDQKINDLKLEHQKLILVGFSQGTMMSVQYAIRQKKKIAGVLGYSGKIYDYELFNKELISKPKMRFLHGNIDEIVPIEEMYKSVDFLKQKDFEVDCKAYEGLGHSISPDGLSDGLDFIKSLNL